ncbi:HIT family protein [Notoacmeibacter marinus]|uniref:HIT family protein n=1 Tax=Notoacmeibacter marinus TaxID=1876515 RepID=A0A231V0R6_9HYPH|nr:HIT family protein [Notoacmeibacter marinus]OXT01793.1 HIT family protein [Notoacmeibacter marinus]
MLTFNRHSSFEIDRTLEADSHPICWLGLCELRLIDDKRWPWVVLIPQRNGMTELHELTPLDQTMMTFEANEVAEALCAMSDCDKINRGALGNIVSQLHYHIIARNAGDPNWPGPVWGYGVREPYEPQERLAFCEKLKQRLTQN